RVAAVGTRVTRRAPPWWRRGASKLAPYDGRISEPCAVSSPPAPAAVDGHDVTVQVIAGGRGEKYDGTVKIAGLAPATGGNAAEDFLQAHRIGAQRGGVVRRHVPRRDGVHVDALARPLVGERLGELSDRAFARRIARHGDTAEKS